MASATARGAAELEIDDHVVQMLRERLPEVATQTVAAVVAEVPGYAGALRGSMGEHIEAAVQMALAGFLKLASRSRDSDPSTPLGPTLDGAYALGRGEARSGRSMDALLAAYRVGARVAWREMADAAAEAGLRAETMAQFAELVFAYIDELSAASVAGHTDELATTGRVRQRYLERLGQRLVSGAAADVLGAAPNAPSWQPPRTLTAVLLPAAQVRGAVTALGDGTLQVGEDLPGLEAAPEGGQHALAAAGPRRRVATGAPAAPAARPRRRGRSGPSLGTAGRRTSGRCGPLALLARARARACSTPRRTSPSWC